MLDEFRDFRGKSWIQTGTGDIQGNKKATIYGPAIGHVNTMSKYVKILQLYHWPYILTSRLRAILQSIGPNRIKSSHRDRDTFPAMHIDRRMLSPTAEIARIYLPIKGTKNSQISFWLAKSGQIVPYLTQNYVGRSGATFIKCQSNLVK